MPNPHDNAQEKPHLTKTDIATNTAESLIKAIPIAGDALAQFIFGPVAELRSKRVQMTLDEIREAISSGKIKATMETEEFANLFEKVLPELARATNEQRRIFLKNLLLNSTKTDPISQKWSDAQLCAELISEIDTPGLAVLGALGTSIRTENYISSWPFPRVIQGGTSDTAFTDTSMTHFPIEFAWPIVAEWTVRLREKRLLEILAVDARGGFPVRLTQLSKMFLDWVAIDKKES